MDIRGSFAFSIIGEKLDFKDIEDKLPIQSTMIIKKGQMVRRNKEATHDLWLYETVIVESENIFNELLMLLETLTPYSEYIKELSSIYERVTISCYLRSDYGQIGYQISNEILRKLAYIGLPLDFHILSFGEVKK